jgi:hypothetical protein
MEKSEVILCLRHLQSTIESKLATLDAIEQRRSSGASSCNSAPRQIEAAVDKFAVALQSRNSQPDVKPARSRLASAPM